MKFLLYKETYLGLRGKSSLHKAPLWPSCLFYSKPCLSSCSCSSKFSQVPQTPLLSLHLLLGPTDIVCLNWPACSPHPFGFSCLGVLLWRLIGGPGVSPGPFWPIHPFSTLYPHPGPFLSIAALRNSAPYFQVSHFPLTTFSLWLLNFIDQYVQC